MWLEFHHIPSHPWRAGPHWNILAQSHESAVWSHQSGPIKEKPDTGSLIPPSDTGLSRSLELSSSTWVLVPNSLSLVLCVITPHHMTFCDPPLLLPIHYWILVPCKRHSIFYSFFYFFKIRILHERQTRNRKCFQSVLTLKARPVPFWSWLRPEDLDTPALCRAEPETLRLGSYPERPVHSPLHLHPLWAPSLQRK